MPQCLCPQCFASHLDLHRDFFSPLVALTFCEVPVAPFLLEELDDVNGCHHGVVDDAGVLLHAQGVTHGAYRFCFVVVDVELVEVVDQLSQRFVANTTRKSVLNSVFEGCPLCVACVIAGFGPCFHSTQPAKFGSGAKGCDRPHTSLPREAHDVRSTRAAARASYISNRDPRLTCPLDHA